MPLRQPLVLQIIARLLQNLRNAARGYIGSSSGRERARGRALQGVLAEVVRRLRRYSILKGYTFVVGGGLFVLGLVGLSSFPPSPPLTENLLHLGTGSIFVAGGLLVNELFHLRTFVGGMGLLMAVGKAVIVVARWTEQGFYIPLVGVVCSVVGVGSLLVATLIGVGASPED